MQQEMEDSFRVRLDKAFGSLSSSPDVTSSSSLWCLSDEEIEKRQWTREPDASIAAEDDGDDDDDDDDAGFSSNVEQFFKDKSLDNPNPNELNNRKEIEDDLKELEENACEETSGNTTSLCRDVGGDDELELEVKNSIGMDCTLDFEEEEDAYDKVAVGREKVGDDRLYMSDVTDYTSHINSFNELPVTFREASRDPRANHLAAKLRLQEDAETARSFNSLHVSEQTQADVCGAHINTPEDENLPKSILKRKDDHIESKTGKRVRFEPTCTEADNGVGSETSNAISLKESSTLLPDSSALVPDYVRHPLRYTHYTFDSPSDMNEESNRQAYTDFLNMVKKSKSEHAEVPADLTKPVIFNPKKKTGFPTKEIKMDEPVQKRSVPLSIAEVTEMEVDEEETVDMKGGNEKRIVRTYRSKPIADSDEPDS